MAGGTYSELVADLDASQQVLAQRGVDGGAEVVPLNGVQANVEVVVNLREGDHTSKLRHPPPVSPSLHYSHSAQHTLNTATQPNTLLIQSLSPNTLFLQSLIPNTHSLRSLARHSVPHTLSLHCYPMIIIFFFIHVKLFTLTSFHSFFSVFLFLSLSLFLTHSFPSWFILSNTQISSL